MLSKSNALDISFSPDSWGYSVAVHVCLFGFVIGVSLWHPTRRTETVDVRVIEKAAPAPAIPELTHPKEEFLARKRPVREHAVFGASRRSIVAESGSGVEVKAGNTIAKPPDQEKLRPADEDALSTPVDEYLVTEMPQVISEMRAPYPPEARKKKVQGDVIVDILVDSKGAVRESQLVSGPGEGLNEAALEAIKNFKFKPALVDGKPVTVKIRYAYHFVLDHL